MYVVHISCKYMQDEVKKQIKCDSDKFSVLSTIFVV